MSNTKLSAVVVMLAAAVFLLPAQLYAAESPETQCPVHKETLQKDTVEILYGRIALPDDYRKARKESFPKSILVAYGGCEVNETSPKTKEVLFCQLCRESEKKWKQAHKRQR